MKHSTKTSLLPQTEKDDEIEGGRKMDHLIEINDQTKKSINQIFDELFEDLDNSSIKSCTIFKVTARLRESNPDAYTPKMVSIGPYHRKDPQLRSMEKYKLMYLRRFLQRKEGLHVERCISELEKLKEEARKCYDDIEDLDNDMSHTGQFMQMLLLDGCFVIEFIRELHGICLEGEDKTINTKAGCRYDQILQDLMLLENQLPFFVLNKLHHMTKQDGELPFAILAKCSFSINIPKGTHAPFLEKYNAINAGNIKHLLHLIHMSWRENPKKDPPHFWKSLCCNLLQIIRWKEKPEDMDNIKVFMTNATELSEAGVSFTKFGNIYRSFEIDDIEETSLFGIKFEKGQMQIPCLRVFDSTESNLRNLIAYEQQSPDVHPRYISNFAIFMDYLIDSDKDVKLLRKKGIIVNHIGDDRDVTKIFNSIGKGVTMDSDFYCIEECRKAIQHCEKPWNRWKENLKYNYFSSPWEGAATVGAIILLILTAVQTILAFTGGIKN